MFKSSKHSRDRILRDKGNLYDWAKKKGFILQ